MSDCCSRVSDDGERGAGSLAGDLAERSRPMMCAYPAQAETKQHGGLPHVRARLRWPDHAYEEGLKLCCGILSSLMVMFGTIAMTGYLYGSFPKASVLSSDPGCDQRPVRGGAGYFLPDMMERQAGSPGRLSARSGVDTVGAA